MKKNYVLMIGVIVLVLLLIVSALYFFWPKSQTGEQFAFFPIDTTTRTFTGQTVRHEEYVPESVQNGNTPSRSTTPRQTTTTKPTTFQTLYETIRDVFRPEASSGDGYFDPFSSLMDVYFDGSGNMYQYNTEVDGVTTPPQTNPRPNTGGVISGGSGTDDDPYFSFDPRTGELTLGDDYQFSFAVGTIVDANTSNSTGDPDNMVFGQAIGLTIGSLIGSPSLGLQYGTLVGSNLFPGYRLSDFGIELNNGALSFNSDAFNKNFGDKKEGKDKGQQGDGTRVDFGGKAELTLCTCPDNLNYIWEVTESPEGKYDGSYLLEQADTGFLGGDGLVYPGEFNFLGQYEQGTSATCEDLVSLYPYECEENSTDFIGTVVAEQMTCTDDKGNTSDCYVTGTSREGKK